MRDSKPGVLAAEELREEIVSAYRDAIETGDNQALRRAEAAERLLSRVYGKSARRWRPPSVCPKRSSSCAP